MSLGVPGKSPLFFVRSLSICQNIQLQGDVFGITTRLDAFAWQSLRWCFPRDAVYRTEMCTSFDQGSGRSRRGFEICDEWGGETPSPGGLKIGTTLDATFKTAGMIFLFWVFFLHMHGYVHIYISYSIFTRMIEIDDHIWTYTVNIKCK